MKITLLTGTLIISILWRMSYYDYQTLQSIVLEIREADLAKDKLATNNDTLSNTVELDESITSTTGETDSLLEHNRTIDIIYNPPTKETIKSKINLYNNTTSNKLIETITIDVGSCVIGEILQPGGPYTCRSSYQYQAPETPQDLVVVFNTNASKPDSRIYYASDIDVPYPQRPPECKTLSKIQPQPWESDAINILWSWESTQHDQFEHNPLNMSQYSIFLGGNPTLQSSSIFSNLGFDHLHHRLRHPIIPPEQRMSDGLVVWVAKNCHSVSRRLEYIKRLNEVIPVHSIGKCWNNHHANFSLKSTGRGLLRDGFGMNVHSEWIQMGTRYKFYFAAENYICDGYVSEKMWIALAYGMVPIIYGTSVHANFMPSNDSYIDVRNFTSSKQLGKFLLQLDNDNDAYMQYHEWRNRSEEQWNSNFVGLLNTSRQWHITPEHGWATKQKNWHNRKRGIESWMCNLAAEISRQKRSKKVTLKPFEKCSDATGESIPI